MIDKHVRSERMATINLIHVSSSIVTVFCVCVLRVPEISLLANFCYSVQSC